MTKSNTVNNGNVMAGSGPCRGYNQKTNEESQLVDGSFYGELWKIQ